MSIFTQDDQVLLMGGGGGGATLNDFANAIVYDVDTTYTKYTSTIAIYSETINTTPINNTTYFSIMYYNEGAVADTPAALSVQSFILDYYVLSGSIVTTGGTFGGWWMEQRIDTIDEQFDVTTKDITSIQSVSKTSIETHRPFNTGASTDFANSNPASIQERGAHYKASASSDIYGLLVTYAMRSGSSSPTNPSSGTVAIENAWTSYWS